MSIELEGHEETGYHVLYILRCDLCREAMWRQEGSLPRPPDLCSHCAGTPEGISLRAKAQESAPAERAKQILLRNRIDDGEGSGW